MMNLEQSQEFLAEAIPGIHFPELELQPLYFGQGTVHPTKKALVGVLDGNPYLYAEPSGRYQIVRHEEVAANTMDFIESSELKDMYGKPVFVPKLWDNGAKMKMTVNFPESQMAVDTPRGSVFVSPRISLINSYDLSMKLNILFEALQLVCSNGMMAMRAIAGSQKRHMVGIDVAKQLGLIAPALENYPNQMLAWSKLSRIDMPSQQFEEWIPNLPFGQGAVDNLMHLPIIGSLSSHDTLYKQFVNGKIGMWDAHNAVTQYITHEITSEDVRLNKSELAEDAFMKLIS
jgi:hypothetical protein